MSQGFPPRQQPRPGPPPTWPAPHERHHPAPWGHQAPPAPAGQRDDRTAAVFGYLGMLVASILVPLVFYLVRRRESPFVRRHAAQAMNLSLTALGYTLAAALLGIPIPLLEAAAGDALAPLAITCVVLVYTLWAVNVVTLLVYLVVAAVQASHGRHYRIPGWRCWRMIR